jgi:hypothetical protein
MIAVVDWQWDLGNKSLSFATASAEMSVALGCGATSVCPVEKFCKGVSGHDNQAQRKPRRGV